MSNDPRYKMDTRKGELYKSWEQLRQPAPVPPLSPGRFKEPGLPEIHLSFIGSGGCDFQVYDNFGNRQPFSLDAAPARRLAAFLNAVADEIDSLKQREAQ